MMSFDLGLSSFLSILLVGSVAQAKLSVLYEPVLASNSSSRFGLSQTCLLSKRNAHSHYFDSDTAKGSPVSTSFQCL